MDQDIGAVYGAVVGASFLPSGGSRRPCKQILFEMKATIPLFPLIDLACRSGNKGCFDPSTLSDHHQ
jgi:hypothetical protein